MARAFGGNLSMPCIHEGSLLFIDRSIRVLFDTGASYSSVSMYIVGKIYLDVVCSMNSLQILNPTGVPQRLV